MIKQIQETHRNNFDIYLFEDTKNKDFELEVFSDEAGFDEDDMFFSYPVLVSRKTFQTKRQALKHYQKLFGDINENNT